MIFFLFGLISISSFSGTPSKAFEIYFLNSFLLSPGILGMAPTFRNFQGLWDLLLDLSDYNFIDPSFEIYKEASLSLSFDYL